MAGKQTQYTQLFGWLTILMCVGMFLCIPLSTILPPRLDAAYFNYFGFLVLPSFIAWLIARRYAKKQPQAIAVPPFVPPAPAPAVAPPVIAPEPETERFWDAPFIDLSQEKLTKEPAMGDINVGSNGGKQYLKISDRNRHVYISGKTQHGKSTLMRGMIYQDILNGNGVCVIDAKGDMIPKLLPQIPHARRNDCIFLDLKTPIPIDFMQCTNQDEVMNLVSDIVQIFDRLDDGLGVRMDAIIRYTVMSLHLMGGATFFDIYNALTDERFRQSIRDNPAIQNNPYLKRFWTEQAEKLIKGESGTAIAISRMTRFVLSPAFQVILGTPNAEFTFADAIEKQKVILVQLQPNSDEGMLYGSLIVSKIQQAIFRRTGSTPPFMLYVDEFQNFRPSGFDRILSMAGGLGLYLTMANQYFSQLRDPGLEDAIINNVSTYFLFRMIPDNAARLKGELRTPDVYQDLSPFHEEIAEIKKGIRFWQKRIDDDDEIDRDTYAYVNEIIQRGKNGIKENERLIEEARRPAPTFVDLLSTLAVGHCIYRAADGSTHKITTPLPNYPEDPSQAQFIYENTLAQCRTKRNVDNPPCNSPTVPHHENNDDEPQPGGTPSVPLHQG